MYPEFFQQKPKIMKLHLPKAIVAALTAVYAAALPLATTVGTGGISIAGVATFAGTQAQAETTYSWNGSAIVATDSANPDAPTTIEYTVINSGTASRGEINVPADFGDNDNVNINYTNGGNLGAAVNWGTHDIKFTTGAYSEDTQTLTPDHSIQIVGNGAITARTILFDSGRYGFSNVGNLNGIIGAIFSVGGQLWLEEGVGNGVLTTHVYIGSSNYSENNRAAGCSLRLDRGTVNNVSLVEDASICSFQTNQSNIGKIGTLDLGGHNLTLKGGGVRVNAISGSGNIVIADEGRLVFDAGNISNITNNITLNAGTSLAVVDESQNVYNYVSFSNLSLAGNATLVTGHGGQWGSGIIVNGLSIASSVTSLTLKDEHAATNNASVVVLGKDIGADIRLNDTLTINQSNDGSERKFVVIVDRETLLTNAVVNMTASSASGYAALAVGSGMEGGASTVKIKGLTSSSQNTYVISYNRNTYTDTTFHSASELVSEGGHTLALTGDGQYTFGGTVDLLVHMEGSGIQTLKNVGTHGGLSASNGKIIVNGVYSAGANTFTTTGKGSISFADTASINVHGWEHADNEQDLSTYNGFLGYTYTLFSNGANVSLAAGGVTLMDGTTNLGKATLSTSEAGVGTLSLGNSVYNLASGTKTYSSIRTEATTGDTCALQMIQVQNGGTLSIDGAVTDHQLSPSLCLIHGTGTLELAWSGRMTSDASSAGATSFEAAISGFTGSVVVKNGAILDWRGNRSFRSLTVEDGGNFSLMKGTYTGDVSIVGEGSIGKDNDYCGAMKLGLSTTLDGSVYISGDSAAISMWENETSTITGDIVGQQGSVSELKFWHCGGNSNSERLTVNGNLVRINSVEVHRGTLIVNGTLSDIASSFTKTGDGSMSIGTISEIDTVNVTGGTLTIVNVNLEGVETFAKTGEGALTVTNATDVFFDKLDIQGGRVVLSGSTLTDSGTGKIVYNGVNTNSGYNGDGKDHNALGGRDLVIKGDVSYAGEFVVQSGTLALGDAIGTAPGNLSIKQITIQNGALMRIQGSGSDSHTTNIKLENGGTLYMHDSNAATNVNHFDQLIVAGAETKMEIAWKGTMLFESLTGEGKLTMKNYNADTRTVEFKQIVNFNGTVTDNMVGTFKIGHVSQDSDFSATIDGTHVSSLSSDDFRKSGAGALAMSNLTINADGTLYMTYEGDLRIGTAETPFSGLTVNNGTTLKYDDASNLISLGSSNVAEGVTSLIVDINDVTANSLFQGGYDLGIHSGFNKEHISVSGWTSDAYTLTDNNGYWCLTLSTAWDFNWGVSEIAKAPTTIQEAALTADTYLSANGSGYLSDGVASIVLTGSQTGTPNVYGGNHLTNGTTTGASWINLKEGNYGILAGGSYAQWQENAVASAFTGDSHIKVDGGSANFIIGGNHQDCNASTFTGDTYISVTGGTINGSIIGASTASHNSNDAFFEGDTHIFIYTPLEGTGATLDGASNLNLVIGARAHLQNTSHPLNDTNTSGVRTHGNTHISIETGDKSGSFTKCIVGANYHSVGDSNMLASNSQGTNMLLQGSTNVSINSSDGVSYSNFIIAGSRSDNVDLGRDKITDKITGSTNLAISGGTFTNKVIGGSYLEKAGYVMIEGGTHVNLTGGTFSEGVFGGSYFAAGTSGAEIEAKTGAVSVVLDGAGLAGDLHGGSYVGAWRNGDASHIIDHTAGVSVQVLSGSVNNVYGGSVSSSGSAYIQQGNVTVDLQGGTVNGNVYAAGKQESTNSTFRTASTTVQISSGVEFGGTGEHIVSGGYTAYGANTEVTDTATLELGSTGNYSNLTSVKLQDFDFIRLASDATVKSLAFTTSAAKEVTVQGDGVLTISNGLSKVSALNVEGTLNLTGSIDEHGGTFTKRGNGTLTLTGNATQIMNGALVVEAGTLELSNVFSITRNDTQHIYIGGTTGNAATIAFADGGSLSYDGVTYTAKTGLASDTVATISSKGVSQELSLWNTNQTYSNLSIRMNGAGTEAEPRAIGATLDNSDLTLNDAAAEFTADNTLGKLTLEGNNATAIVKGSTVSIESATIEAGSKLKAMTTEAKWEDTDANYTMTATGERASLAHVKLGATSITGTTNEDGTLKELGEMTGLTLEFTAAATISNVTMRDVTISGGAVNMNGVVAIASFVAEQSEPAPARMMALAAEADAGSAGTQTLTATPLVHDSTYTGSNDLTVDIDSSVLSPANAGKTLTWTIFDNVSLAADGSVTLHLGKNLTDMLRNGQPKVTLSGDWVNNGDHSVVLSHDAMDNLITGTGGLLAGSVTSGNLVLTVENMPEPTTGTLSVLALAALAARRRRRK